MVLCDTCKHLGNMASWPCEDCLQGDRYERKPTTNADRIRQMSDEEIANLLLKFDVCGQMSLSECSLHNCNCESCVLDWLKQEVEDDG